MPVTLPGGGTIAAGAGSVSKPAPGTLSNGAASFERRCAVVRRRLDASDPARGPSSFICRARLGGQGRRRRDDADAHLQRQRPAGGVVRTLGRTAGILAQVGIAAGRRAPRAPSPRTPGRSGPPRCRPEMSRRRRSTGAVSCDTRTPPNASRRSSSTAATGSRCCLRDEVGERRLRSARARSDRGRPGSG